MTGVLYETPTQSWASPALKIWLMSDDFPMPDYSAINLNKVII